MHRDTSTPTRQATAAAPGYYGRPMLKAPVWTWEIPTYFFVGGLAGMAAVLAAAMWIVRGDLAFVLAALWIALVGAGVSAVLLILDLGRPKRFLYMLRVFKWRSPMSVGVWVLTLFGGAVALALGAALWLAGGADGGDGATAAAVLIWVFAIPGALLGSIVATYTGVLIGATVVPVWHSHRRVLPLHFGTAALGSAAAALELLGHAPAAMNALGWLAALVVTVLAIHSEANKLGDVDAAMHRGLAGTLLRASHLVAPLSIVCRLLGWPMVAAVLFLIGAAVGRFGWMTAGKASANDVRAGLAARQ